MGKQLKFTFWEEQEAPVVKKELDCPFDFTSRCAIDRCNCKPKED